MDYQFRAFFEIAGALVIVMFMNTLISVLTGNSFGGGVSHAVDELTQPLELIDVILCGLVYYFYKGLRPTLPKR